MVWWGKRKQNIEVVNIFRSFSNLEWEVLWNTSLYNTIIKCLPLLGWDLLSPQSSPRASVHTAHGTRCSLNKFFSQSKKKIKKFKINFRKLNYQNKKCLDCSETKKYANIFCEVFASVSVKILHKIATSANRGGGAGVRGSRPLRMPAKNASFFRFSFIPLNPFLVIGNRALTWYAMVSAPLEVKCDQIHTKT